ncbi:ATP-binding cassette, subfamily B [Actinacidiphila yanglinensis]|uniref:Fatty acid ABC transporter ATP-binding/permease protein n=1 Tax=Actinacidiphila yanglinensis TaxID=310779 RepID=A0A1H5TYE1_9ACTN|nr:ABC transporter ATP-binding protein [Actinacidiphila yanglinensis]SEF67750.1 ATP-binding cassette, subfamily B [Actinacidiphila yanglinensis]
MTTAPPGFRRTSLRLLGLIRPYRRLSGVAVLGVGSIALNVSGPWLLGRATDHVFHARATSSGLSVHGVVLPLLAAAGAYAGSGLLWALQGRFTTRIVQRAVYALRASVEDKLTRLPLSYVDQQPRGEVLSRTTNDIDNIAQSMQQTLSQITNSVLLLVGVLGAMFWISPLLALVAVVAVPLSMYTTRLIGRRAQPQFDQQWKTTGELNSHIEEAYTGFALVKAFGRHDESAAEFDAHNELLYDSSARAQLVSGAIGPVTTVIGNVSYVVVAVVGGLQLASGALSIGAVQAFVQYSRQFTQPLMAAAALSNLVQSGVASADRVFAFLDAPEEVPTAPGAAAPRPDRGRVCFEQVAFRYRPDRPVIRNLTLTVEPGRLVAIVGPTGAGKTTLVNLLMRFYDIDAGRITVDGVDIRTMDRDALRSLIGMVLQDTWLFGGTIRENIGYGRAGATDEEIRAAAAAAHVDHFVRTLSDGYDTVIDDEGSGVSAGERQLLTIARAMVADPLILVLDEATSSVDTRTELLLQQAMARLSRGRTSFVIAHRLSTIREADLILMMVDGDIVEQGTHDELLAAGGAYARLHAAQFARPLDEQAPAEGGFR